LSHRKDDVLTRKSVEYHLHHVGPYSSYHHQPSLPSRNHCGINQNHLKCLNMIKSKFFKKKSWKNGDFH